MNDAPSAAPVAAVDPSAAVPRELPLRLVGSGSGYFRIWIVNLLLTLVTLGLYYPFAQVASARLRLEAMRVVSSVDPDELLALLPGSDDAAHLLLAAGRDPAAMVLLFERLEGRSKPGEGQARGGPPIAFASHPADEERIRYFREAARSRR